MRIALVDDSSRRVWTDCRPLFDALVGPLLARGHEVIVLEAGACGLRKILTGFARERDALPLIASTQIAAKLLREPVDICLFPEEDGLAHATLMARACGEIHASTRIVLWHAPAAPAETRAASWASYGLRDLTAGAMRRFCAAMADPIVEPAQRVDIVRSPAFTATIVLLPSDAPIREFVYCGLFTRKSGFVSFIEAIEALEKTGLLSDKAVRLVGSFIADVGGVDREWFSRRAAAWSFRFFVVETCALDVAVASAVGPNRATLVAEAGPDLVDRLSAIRRADLLVRMVLPHERYDARLLADLLAGHGDPQPFDLADEITAYIEKLLAVPVPELPQGSNFVGLSVCILHYERPALLGQAIESVLAQIDGTFPLEIVVLDNASVSPEAKAGLAAAAKRPNVRVERLDHGLPYSSALNVAAESATQPFLVFLDDDNRMAQGGLVRLAKACAADTFDVITSALDLFDDEVSVGLMTFIGPAHTAGLFFNGFGDNCMAFRRKDFLRIGGYLQREAAYPCADWILLCRAQAAGLRIGVIQQPAFRYRRNPNKAAEHWQPWDRQIVRAMLLDHYGEFFDAYDLARIAQAMALELGI